MDDGQLDRGITRCETGGVHRHKTCDRGSDHEQQRSVDVACPGEVIPANVHIVMLLMPANRL